MPKKIKRSLHFDAHLWLDKTYGNTYFSVKVWVDGQVVAILPMEYGYGRQFETSAHKKLVELGYLDESTFPRSLYQVGRDQGFDYYSSETYGLKKELFAASEYFVEVSA